MKNRPRSSRSAADWTDANVHDPGITLLELLVFAVAALIAVGVVIKWRRRCRLGHSNSG
jgi:hypothetical protein